MTSAICQSLLIEYLHVVVVVLILRFEERKNDSSKCRDVVFSFAKQRIQ